MKKLNTRERFILGLMLLLLGIFVLDRYVWSPIAQKLQKLDHAVAAGKSQLLHDRRLLADSEKIKSNYAAFVLANREEGKTSPSNELMATLKEVESVAKRCGVKINNIKPQGTQDGANRNSAVFLSMESSWDPLMHFVYQIQRSPQLLQIQKADLQGKGEDGTLLTGQLVIGRARSEEIPL